MMLSTLMKQVDAYDAYYTKLRKNRKHARKYLKEVELGLAVMTDSIEQQLDDLRVEWALAKSDKRMNEFNRDIVDLSEEILNVFLISDETLTISDLKKRLDIGSGFNYDIEQGMLTRAVRMLEADELIKVTREPGMSMAYQSIAREEKDAYSALRVDAHGVSKCLCDGCQIQLNSNFKIAQNGERMVV